MKRKSAKNKKRASETTEAESPAPHQEQPALSWHHKLIPAGILAALTGLIYYPSLHYEFQFDDIANIMKHFKIRHYNFGDLVFSGPRWISYWFNSLHYKIGKFDPFSYRVGNLVLHTTNGLLVFFLLLFCLSNLKKRSFFKDNALALSFVTALLFLLHPVQTQTVSYVIQGELEGLATFFILSMALCLAKITHTKSQVTQYICTGLLYAFAILSTGSKEISIISPVLLMIFDWFLIAQGSWKNFKKRLLLHATLLAIVTTIYLYLLKPKFFTEILGLQRVAKNNIGNAITHDPRATITPWMFFISQFKVIIHYLWMFIWPFNISVEYDWKLARSIFAPDAIFPLIFLIGLAILVIKRLRKNPSDLIAFGAVWFFVCLAPRSSIIPSPELLVDYKTYMASIGWLFILATGIVIGIQKIIPLVAKRLPMLTPALAQPAMVLALALPLGIATVQRNTVWRSGLEFWANMMKNAPGKARVHNNYGVELSQKGNFKEAIFYFKKAIKMDNKYPDPHNNLAVAYSRTNEIDKAIEALKAGIRIHPYYPEGYNNIASFFLQKKQPEKAKRALATALKLRPHYGKAYFNLGRVYIELNQKEKAWECFKKACFEADLDTDIGFYMYGRVSLALKKYDDAIVGYTKALELNATIKDARFNLANAYFLSKKHKEALPFFESLIKKHPKDAKIAYNLAETYFMLNRPKEALNWFVKLKPLKDKLPTLGIRIAGCLEKIGQPIMAKKELAELLKQETTPASVKSKAQEFLDQMNKRYPGRVVVA